MALCRLCRFDIELDDVRLNFTSGMVICLKCFTRETQTDKPMPVEVRRSTEQTINAIQA